MLFGIPPDSLARGMAIPAIPRIRERLAELRNLGNLLVHLFGRHGRMERIFPSSVHDRCLFCEGDIKESTSYQSYRVCPYCRFHYSLSARQRIQLLADRKSFKESHKYLNSVAPISFSRQGFLP